MKNLRKARAVRTASCSLAVLVAASSVSAQGWLTAPQRIASTPQTAGYHIARGDRDLDGDVDLVQVVGMSLAVRTNQGNGTFVPGATFVLPPGFVGPFVVGDYDADGRTDLALAALPFSSVGSAVVVLPTTAGGGFAAPIAVPLPPGYLVDRLVRGDANGDGVDDVCIVTFGFGSMRRAQWLLGNVNRSFLLAAGNTIPGGQGSLVDGLTTLDANGDGLSDPAVLGAGLVQVLITNNAVPTPSTSTPVVFAAGPAWLCASDLDGDQNQDFVDAGAVLFGDGTGAPPGGGPDARQNQLLDWEGDGDLVQSNGLELTIGG